MNGNNGQKHLYMCGYLMRRNIFSIFAFALYFTVLADTSALSGGYGDIIRTDSCKKFQHGAAITEHSLFTAFDLSVEYIASEDDFVTIKYDERYAKYAGGSKKSTNNRNTSKIFLMGIFNNNVVFQHDNYKNPKAIYFRFLLDSRGAHISSKERLPNRASRKLEKSRNINDYKIIGPINSFYGYTETMYSDMPKRKKENRQIYVNIDDEDKIENFMVCGRIDKYPNPHCKAYVDAGIFDLEIFFERKQMTYWNLIQKQALDFTKCLKEE